MAACYVHKTIQTRTTSELKNKACAVDNVTQRFQIMNSVLSLWGVQDDMVAQREGRDEEDATWWEATMKLVNASEQAGARAITDFAKRIKHELRSASRPASPLLHCISCSLAH